MPIMCQLTSENFVNFMITTIIIELADIRQKYYVKMIFHSTILLSRLLEVIINQPYQVFLHCFFSTCLRI